jgi:hypothetical protein
VYSPANIPTPTALVANPAAYAGLLKRDLKLSFKLPLFAAISLNHSCPFVENIENGGMKLRASRDEILHP